MVGDSTDAVWGVMDVYPVTNFPDIRKKCTLRSHAGNLMVRKKSLFSSKILLTQIQDHPKRRMFSCPLLHSTTSRYSSKRCQAARSASRCTTDLPSIHNGSLRNILVVCIRHRTANSRLLLKRQSYIPHRRCMPYPFSKSRTRNERQSSRRVQHGLETCRCTTRTSMFPFPPAYPTILRNIRQVPTSSRPTISSARK